jgi:peptidoglycan/xylan/chitin deacetylase (PgdA/CDA1 family)
LFKLLLGFFAKTEKAMRINLSQFYLSFLLMLSMGMALPSFASESLKTCKNEQNSQSETSVSQFSQIFNWIVNPEIALARIIHTIGHQMMVQANNNLSPWPTIHEQARLARVPVIMYHDILPQKQVSFDVTIKQFKQHLESIQENGLTPISLEQLTQHLQTGKSLPEKPIVLSFDDGYSSHYDIVYPLLKQYNYPAVFSIYTDKVDGKIVGRSSVNWEQLQEMAANPLMTIASHSVTHPKDLTTVSDSQLQKEIVNSKQILEEKLGIQIDYFTYPEGNYDERVSAWVKAAGYEAALTMENHKNILSNQSKSLLAIDRFGQSGLEKAIDQSWGGMQLPTEKTGFDFNAPIVKNEVNLDQASLILVSGGKPMTIHADSRYQVQEILEKTNAFAGVDGGFFSMKTLTTNQMIGPVLSQTTGEFIPGNNSENRKLKNRPLILIGSDTVRFIPFDPEKHNTLEGIQSEVYNVTDAFVAGGFLVKNSQPQSPESFGGLFDFDAPRHRAFWGIHRSGQPMIGITAKRIDSVSLSQILAQIGFRDAVMLDSGASTSMAFQGQSMVKQYVPRPVPHVVALISPEVAFNQTCMMAKLIHESED